MIDFITALKATWIKKPLRAEKKWVKLRESIFKN